MADLTIEDAREQIIPLFMVDGTDASVNIESRMFLGTAFFITKHGDAVTASHVVPKTESLPVGKRLVAIVQIGDTPTVCWIVKAVKFDQWDFAIVRINIDNNKYFEIDSRPVYAGTDVWTIGVPSHEVWNAGKEMRMLKGYVTLTSNFLELNIPIPKGMSGAPVFVDQKVVGFASGSIKSEEIEDSNEHIERLSDHKEQIVITKILSVTHYGLAFPFSKIANLTLPALGGMTFLQFVQSENSRQS